MENAPKISQDNTEKPKDSIADKLKRWAKIGAIATVGFLPLEDAQAGGAPTNNKDKTEREAKIDSLINEIKKIGTKSKSEIKNAREDIKNAHKNYDEQKEWLKDVIGSEEYKERMLKELDSNEKEADIYTKHRKENLNDKDYNLVYGSTVDGDHVVGEYSENDKSVKLATNPPSGHEATGLHEFVHDITDGGATMTKKAIDLYKQSFNPNIIRESNSEEIVNYLEEPTERDARKKVLEYDLEKLGVKKYGEVFTQEHYEKVLELAKKGMLSKNSLEFIVTTKPEFFLQIMNEIAENPKIASTEEQKA